MATVDTEYGLGEIVATDVDRGRKAYLVKGAGFQVWIPETQLRTAVADVDESNSVALPYNPDPQHPAYPEVESTMQPGGGLVGDPDSGGIDADDRLHPADSLTFEDRAESEAGDHPAPAPHLFAGSHHEASSTTHLLSDPTYLQMLQDQLHHLAPDFSHVTEIGEQLHNAWEHSKDAVGDWAKDKWEDLSSDPYIYEEPMSAQEWLEAHPEPDPMGMDETDFAQWVFDNVDPAARHEGPHPSGLGAAPREEVVEFVRQNPRKDTNVGLSNSWFSLTGSLYDRPAGLGDRYIEVDAYLDPTTAAFQLKDDPVGFMERKASLWSSDGGLDPRIAEVMDLEDSDPMVRQAAWVDVRDKAHRLWKDGAVAVKETSPHAIYASVTGDHGTYETIIVAASPTGGPRNGAHVCSCPWGTWTWQRKKSNLGGRPCSHVMACLYEMQSRLYKGQPRAPKQARSIHEAVPLTLRPHRLTPDFIFDGTEEQIETVDVTEDERQTTGPDEIVHFAALKAAYDRDNRPYPPELAWALMEASRRVADGPDVRADGTAPAQPTSTPPTTTPAPGLAQTSTPAPDMAGTAAGAVPPQISTGGGGSFNPGAVIGTISQIAEPVIEGIGGIASGLTGGGFGGGILGARTAEIEDLRDGIEGLEQLRELADEGTEPWAGRMDERNEKVRELVDDLRADGVDASQMVAHRRLAFDPTLIPTLFMDPDTGELQDPTGLKEVGDKAKAFAQDALSMGKGGPKGKPKPPMPSSNPEEAVAHGGIPGATASRRRVAFPGEFGSHDQPFSGSGPDPREWIGSSDDYVAAHEGPFVDVTDLGDDDIIKYSDGRDRVANRWFVAGPVEDFEKWCDSHGVEPSTPALEEYSRDEPLFIEEMWEIEDHLRNGGTHDHVAARTAAPRKTYEQWAVEHSRDPRDNNTFHQYVTKHKLAPEDLDEITSTYGVYTGSRTAASNQAPTPESSGGMNVSIPKPPPVSLGAPEIGEGGEESEEEENPSTLEKIFGSKDHDFAPMANTPQPRQASLNPPEDFGDDGDVRLGNYERTDDNSDIVRQFHARTGGSLDWLKSSSDPDRERIAAAAQAAIDQDRPAGIQPIGMARTAGRKFTPAEEAELVEERHALGARNLDKLDLEGTHYIMDAGW